MIVTVKTKGRCVFADKAYKKNEVIEVCEYITIPQNQIEILKKTIINDYWFGMNGDQGDALIILGNGSLYNHSTSPNMIPAMEQGTFGFVAIKDIEPGDELVFDYGYTPHFHVESSLQIVGYKKNPNNSRIKKKEGMEINKIYNENCLETMAKMPDNFIDLTVTSPPYDDLRTYNGYCFDFENVAKELFRVTKQGGVVVWNVNDATKNGSETLTSLRQVLFFNQIGFNVETMIWEKTGSGCLGSNKFYGQNFEYMFILTKGMPKTTNLICDRENKVKSGTVKVNGGLDKTGKGKDRIVERKPFGKRNNIWRFDTQKNTEHPAPFPEQLANDHILSWSNENDLVYDPFMGSGTTAKMAILNNRKYIGSEISAEYCKIIETRIKECGGLFFNSFETELSNEAGT